MVSGSAALTAWTALSAALLPTPARAAPLRISVAHLQSQQSCSTYVMSSGQSSVNVSPYAVSASASWRTWLAHDCVDNFATIRATLQAALTAGLDSPGPGGSYTLSGTIATMGASASGATDGDYDVRSEKAAVTFSYVIRNAAGAVVYGGTIVKTVETGATVQGSDVGSTSAIDGQALYTHLENAVSSAVARAVIFHLAPLRVADGPDGDVRLNYGSPLLAVGTLIQAPSANGRPLRYVVSSVGRGQAVAEPDGERGDVAIGSEATVIEPEDTAANARRYHKVDLP